MNEQDQGASFVYTVRATFEDPAIAQEWIDWLKDGHMQRVLNHGATDCEIVSVEAPEATIDVRYHFPSRDSFTNYELNHAPQLRAENLKTFPPDRGIAYERSVGVVEARA